MDSTPQAGGVEAGVLSEHFRNYPWPLIEEVLEREDALPLLDRAWRGMIASGSFIGLPQGVLAHAEKGLPTHVSVHSLFRSAVALLGPAAGTAYGRLLCARADSGEPSGSWQALYSEVLHRAEPASLREYLRLFLRILDGGLPLKEVLDPSQANVLREILSNPAAFRQRVRKELDDPARRADWQSDHARIEVANARACGVPARSLEDYVGDLLQEKLEKELQVQDRGVVRGDVLLEDWKSAFKGLFWSAAGVLDDDLLQALSGAVLRRALTWELWSPIAVAVGFSAHPRRGEILSAMKARVKNKPVLKTIERLLGRAASAAAMSTAEYEDRLASDHGLGPDGARRWEAGARVAVLRLTENGSASLAAFDTERNRELKELPASFKEAREEKKGLLATQAVQRRRLEAAMIAGRVWSGKAWAEIFGGNPVLGAMGRRLVWKSGGGFVLFEQGLPEPAAELSLPHPLSMPEEELEKWRSHLATRGIVQPFRQVFRELYRFQPEERGSKDASRRFDGQVVPMNSLYALARGSGWSGFYGSGMYGSTDGDGHRVFREAGVAAVLTSRPSDVQGERQDVVLRELFFVRPQRGVPLLDQPTVPLESVDPMVFSEAVRDIELLVSVASVGRERPDRPADLGRETLAARHGQLKRVLERCGFEGRVRLQERFAVVEGPKGAFRVHLGSGHVFAADRDDRLDLPPPPPDPETLWLPSLDDVRLAEIVARLRNLAGP